MAVLLHGRGADRHDLMGLRPHLPPHWTLVAPEAPFAGAKWGYGPGSAWYRYLGADRPDPDSFSASLDELHELLTALPGRLDGAGPLVLGGFSQGGTLSMAYALDRPGSVPFVLNLSGFLADHPRVVVEPDRVRGTRFFWGHGIHDPAIPHAMAVQGREALLDAGADLLSADYPIGHWIDPEELAAAVRWVEGTRARRVGTREGR